MIRLLVSYDGTDFRGYQRQPYVRTVQGELERALTTMAGRPVDTNVAGRTDAGVHAWGQVVSVDATDGLHPDAIVRAMPTLLPSDICVLDAQHAAPDFNARFSATSRTYVYLVWADEVPNGLHSRYALWVRNPIDVHALNRALARLEGTHDFSSFGRLRSDQDPVRTVEAASATVDGSFIRIEVRGRSFLHQMVRSMVGTALEVASRKRDADWVSEALEARHRNAAGQVAPPHGLTLIDVDYHDAPWPRRRPMGYPWAGPQASEYRAAGGWA